MNDQIVSGEPGSADGQNGSTSNGSGDGAVNPFEGLETGSLDWIKANGAKSVADVVKMAINSEKMSGGIHIPGKDAKAEDISSFLDKAMANLMPEDASGYEFTMPEGMPEGMPYDEDMASNMKSWMLESGIPPQMADKFHGQIVNQFMIPAYQAEAEAIQQSVDASNALMKKEWGEPDSQEFKTQMEYVLKAVNGFEGYKDALIDAGAIDDDNNILNAKLLMPLAKLGELHFSEDGFVTGDNNAENPFADDTKNHTKQSEVIAKDPAKAKSLIKAAGKEPATFGL